MGKRRRKDLDPAQASSSTDRKRHHGLGDGSTGGGLHPAVESSTRGMLNLSFEPHLDIGDVPYKKGAVVRIKLHNFRAYNSGEMFPGPRLNLILGPNGTGKSSFVDAFVIGLGENHTLLGGSDQLSGYIAYGQTHAELEIELHNPDGDNWVVKRDMVRSSAGSDKMKSSFSLNGESVPVETIHELVRGELGIQLANLAQFLPQFRVREFSKMNPRQLMMATLEAYDGANAANDDSLSSTLKELISLQAASKLTMDSLGAKEEALDVLRDREKELGERVRRLEERSNLEAELDGLNWFLPWAQYDEARIAYMDAKARRDEAKKHYDELKAAHSDAIELKLREAKVAHQDAVDTVESRNKARSRARKDKTAVVKALDNARSTASELRSKLMANERKQESCAAEEVELRKSLMSTEKLLASLGDKEAVEARYYGLRQEKKKLKSKRDAEAAVLAEVRQDAQRVKGQVRRLETQLASLGSENVKRLRRVFARNNNLDNIIRAYQFITHNAGRFKGQVCGPLVDVLEIPVEVHRRYLEDAIPVALMEAFVFESRADEAMFVSAFPRARFTTLIVKNPTVPAAPVDLSDLAEFGVTGYLIDTFVAPDMVKRALCDYGGLHLRVYGDGESRTSGGVNFEALFHAHSKFIKTAYTPSTRATGSWTRYARSRKLMQSITGLKDRLVYFGDAAGSSTSQISRDEEAVKSQLETALNHRAEFARKVSTQEAIVRDLEARLEPVASEMALVSKQVKDIDRLVKRITNIQRDLEAIDRAGLVKEAATLSSKLLKVVTGQAKFAGKLAGLSTTILDTVEAYQLATLKSHVAGASVSYWRHQLEEAQTKLKEAENDYLEILDKAKSLKAEATRLSKVAKSAHGDLTDADLVRFKNEFSVEVLGQSRFMTVAEVEAKIRDIQIKLSSIVDVQSPIEEYERVCRQARALEGEVAAMRSRVDGTAAKVDALSAGWRPQVDSIVTALNGTFRAHFERLWGDGGVELIHEEDRYETFGIRIMVSFQKGERAIPLTALRQSGGERAVSTMLYHIALQESSGVPWSVVDEINRGLDAVNERRIWEILSFSAHLRDAQCFVITPTLLLNLPYATSTRIHHIMNGPHQAPQSAFDLAKLLS